MTNEVKDLLRESEYYVSVNVIEEDVVKVCYPNGTTQFWGLKYDDDQTTFTNLADDESYECPDYSLPWALTTRIHLDCKKIKYNPAYIFYVDDKGEEVDGLGELIPMTEETASKFISLTTLLKSLRPSSSYEDTITKAENYGVREGFEVCWEISQKENV